MSLLRIDDAATLPNRLRQAQERPTATRISAGMHRSSLTAAVLAATLVADAHGVRSLSLYLVLAAIPLLAWTALAYFGELVEGRAAEDTGALNVGLAAMALALVVLGAGVRAHALEGEALPALGTSAVVGATCLLGLQLVVALTTRFSRERLVAAVRAARSDVR
jgi:hypothetical protein